MGSLIINYLFHQGVALCCSETEICSESQRTRCFLSTLGKFPEKVNFLSAVMQNAFIESFRDSEKGGKS